MLELVCAAVAAVILLVMQAIVLRLRTPRLPPAPGPFDGRVVEETHRLAHLLDTEPEQGTLRLLMFGDSVACGVGCPTNEDAMVGSVARELSSRWTLCSGVKWSVLGRSGATAAQMISFLPQFLPQVSARTGGQVPPLAWASAHFFEPSVHFDACLVSVGVNAVLDGHSPARYAAELLALLEALRRRLGPTCALVVLAMPPMDQFPAVRALWPLSMLLGRYAAAISARTKAVCEATGLAVCVDLQGFGSYSAADARRLMAPDGFHPARGACDIAAPRIVDVMARELEKRRGPHWFWFWFEKRRGAAGGGVRRRRNKSPSPSRGGPASARRSTR